MAQIYSQYTKARIGWFLGLTGWQASIVAASTQGSRRACPG